MTGERWTLGHRPALDGVRGVAILLVLLCHCSIPGMGGGGAVGVTLFFVLSGFLITGLLLEEHDRTGRVSFRSFYVRRARRLLPALVASTLAVAVFAPVLGARWFEWGDLPPVLLYYSNWIVTDPDAILGGVGGTWSLAIEEQFYMLWPLLLLPLARKGRRVVMLAALTGGALSLLMRVNLMQNGATPERVYYGTDTVAVALLAGAALVAWRGARPSGRRSMRAMLAGVAFLAWPTTWAADTAAYFAAPLVTVGGVLLILGATGTSPYPLLGSRVLVWLGQRSYGIYLWHCPLSILLRIQLGWSWPALVAVIVPVSLLLAEVSYQWVEMPFRRPRIQPTRTMSSCAENAVATLVPDHSTEHPKMPMSGISGSSPSPHTKNGAVE